MALVLLLLLLVVVQVTLWVVTRVQVGHQKPEPAATH
jgi:hypothetical protein